MRANYSTTATHRAARLRNPGVGSTPWEAYYTDAHGKHVVCREHAYDAQDARDAAEYHHALVTRLHEAGRMNAPWLLEDYRRWIAGGCQVEEWQINERRAA